MAIFGILVEKDKSVDVFVKKMKNKLKNPDLFQNPFYGFIKKINEKDKNFLLIYLDLVWINPINIALVLTLGLLFVHGLNFHWTMLIVIPLWMGVFMFTTYFSKLATKFTLRKCGYKKKIEYLSDTQLILRLVKWGEKKS